MVEMITILQSLAGEITLALMVVIGLTIVSARSLTSAKELFMREIKSYLAITLEEHRNKAAELVSQGVQQQLSIVKEELRVALADVVKAEAAQDIAEIATQAKTDFLSRMSHEIRTPINGIIGSLSLIKAKDLTNQQAEDLQRASLSSSRLLTVVNEVLDLAAVEAKQIDYQQIPFNLTETCLEAVNSLKPLAKEKGLDLVTEIPAKIIANRVGDPQKIHQVLTNLIGNAIKFTERGTVKLVAASGHDKEVSLTVEDTGIGISKKLQADLFQPFNTASQESKGSGLGLSICQAFVEGMGGGISLASQEKIGSTFTVKLPLPLSKVEDELKSEDRDPILQDMEESKLPLQILSVDDDPVNRRVLQRHLEELGHQVDSAVDGQQAVEKFRQKNYYDIIFMDLLMPEMDGIQACQQIRHIEDQTDTNPVYICAITASVVGEIEDSCRRAGMNNYLSKPFTPDDLEMIIKDYLEDEKNISKASWAR